MVPGYLISPSGILVRKFKDLQVSGMPPPVISIPPSDMPHPPCPSTFSNTITGDIPQCAYPEDPYEIEEVVGFKDRKFTIKWKSNCKLTGLSIKKTTDEPFSTLKRDPVFRNWFDVQDPKPQVQARRRQVIESDSDSEEEIGGYGVRRWASQAHS